MHLVHNEFGLLWIDIEYEFIRWQRLFEFGKLWNNNWDIYYLQLAFYEYSIDQVELEAKHQSMDDHRGHQQRLHLHIYMVVSSLTNQFDALPLDCTHSIHVCTNNIHTIWNKSHSCTIEYWFTGSMLSAHTSSGRLHYCQFILVRQYTHGHTDNQRNRWAAFMFCFVLPTKCIALN